VQRGEGAELLRGDQRAGGAEQHRPRPDADPQSAGRDGGGEHGGRRGADARRQVVLGVPDPAVAEPVEVDGATITQAPLSVTWTADGDGIGDGEFQQFAISVGPLPAAGTDLVLPAHQEYADGEVVDWDQVAEGDAEPEHPAPTFTTTEAAGDHGAATADDQGVDDGITASDDASAADPAAGTADDSGTLPVVLGGLGLAAGVGALVVALLAWRRSAAR